MNEEKKPILLGGVGLRGWDSHSLYPGDRVYSSQGLAVTITAHPLGRTAGMTTMYLVHSNISKHSDNKEHI